MSVVSAATAAVEGSVSPDDVLVAADLLRAALAGFDPKSLRGPDCVRVSQALAETEKTCAAVRLVTAARAVDAGAHLNEGYRSGAAWLARQSGSTLHQAKRDLDIADRLEDRAATRQAFLTGSISKDQATEIVEAAEERPDVERELVSKARTSDLSGLRDRARELRQHGTPPERLHDQQHKARSFRHWRDRLGMVCFSGRLTPEIGVPLISRLEQATAQAKRAARASAGPEDLEKWEAYAADAFAQMCGPTTADKRSVRTELVIVCDLYAWRRGHAHEGEVCQIIGGGPIPVDLAKSLCEDAFVKAALHDGTDIRTVKHFGRHLPAELRTALDLGPVPKFTGRECSECGKRYGLEYDHIDPVGHEGPTCYENLQPLCWEDHQAKTRRDREAGLIGNWRRKPPDPRSPRHQDGGHEPDGSSVPPSDCYLTTE